MVPNLFAPPTNVPCRAYNHRAKSNSSKGYGKVLNRGENVEQAIIYYGYSNDETVSSLASSGNSIIAIPI